MPENNEADRKRIFGFKKILRGDDHRNAKLNLESLQDEGVLQDRIHKWQVQDVEEAVDPDTLSVLSRPKSEAFHTPTISRASSPITIKEPQTTPRKRSTKWVHQDNDEWVKKRRSTRNNQDRNDLQLHEDVDEDVKQSKMRIDHVLRDMPSPTRTRDSITHALNVNSSRAERDERRRRRRDARPRGAAGESPKYHPNSPSLANSQYDSDRYGEDQSHDDSMAGYMNTRPTHITRWNSPADMISPASIYPDNVRPDIEEEQTYRPSRYAQTLGQNIITTDSIQPPKPRRMTLLNKTKEILVGKPDAPPPPSNRIPSIQAWLEEQPGSSFESIEPPSEPNPDVKTPKKHSRRKTVQVEPTMAAANDPNRIWDSIVGQNNPEPDTQRNARKQRPNSLAKESETSPSKRRPFSFEGPESSSTDAKATPLPQDYADHAMRSSAHLQRRGARLRNAVDSPIAVFETPSPSNHQTNKSAYDQPTPVTKSRYNHTSANTEARAQVSAQSKTDQIHNVTLKRKLTHDDLISRLSQPRARKSTKSVRSVRKNQSASQGPLLPVLLEAMRNDEPKYNQELRTLVDGVTPVLLQSLLSKTDAEATQGLFSDSESRDANFTKPIIQMGIALERLKALHNRIPLKDHQIEAFLSWATSAQRYYSDYIKWWRLGFQGITVNLAPLNGPGTAEEELMGRDLDGDVTAVDGQKVDVACLQKRPLVKLKKLFKLISTIRDENPRNEKASKLVEVYADLTEMAKLRYSEELGRLEDEAAANIDITRVRDIRTMAPLPSVEVDKRRKVRARDCFEMTLHHSTGQRMDCRIEIIIRDDSQPQGVSGDILVCQVEENLKWLLFAPINISNVSARKDETSLDLVMMIRGISGISDSWYELLALKADVPDAVVEWIHMLGSNPLPPKISQIQNIVQSEEGSQSLPFTPTSKTPAVPLNAAALASLPSDVDVPIGEPSVVGRSTNKKDKRKSAAVNIKTMLTGSKLNLGGGLQKKELPDLSVRMKVAVDFDKHSSLLTGTQYASSESSRSTGLPVRPRDTPKASGSPLKDKKTTEPLFARASIERARPVNHLANAPQASKGSAASPWTSEISSPLQTETSSRYDDKAKFRPRPYSNRLDPPQPARVHTSSPLDPKNESRRTQVDIALEDKERLSYQRTQSLAESKASVSLTESIREQWAAVSGYTTRPPSTSLEPNLTPRGVNRMVDRTGTPTGGNGQGPSEEIPPPTPPHRRNPKPSMFSSIPAIPTVMASRFEARASVRPSVEIQQGYDSSSSASTSDSEDDADDTSDTSEEDYDSELKDQATPLVTVAHGGRRVSYVQSKALPNLPSPGVRSIQPSESASNVPHRRAPSLSTQSAAKNLRSIAMVCSWSDRGIWEPIQDEECSIVISPGLVQAFKLTAAHSQPVSGTEWNDGSMDLQSPLVEFELTPIVPLRKGTALDITIRSPPTAKSQLRTTNNVMFRSKTTQECDKLYQLINWARCNNPTYAQIARTRAREEQPTFNADAVSTKTRSWFSFGSQQNSSYRASSQPPPSMADTGASGASSFSALTALKRFGHNSPFSLKRSSVVRRSGISITGDSLYSSSNGTSSGSGTSTPVPSQAGFIPGVDGPNVPATSTEAVNGGGMVNNMKVHLFLRQGQKWEQLGQSYLTVLPAVTKSPLLTADSAGQGGTRAPPSTTTSGASAMSNGQSRHYRLPSSSHTPHQIHGDGREKRILITSVKKKELVLLDEILGETCFEKIMQTGIAIKVWKEDEAVLDHGGVLTGRSRTYMVQFKTSMEASWVFNMCGVYRYGPSTSTN